MQESDITTIIQKITDEINVTEEKTHVIEYMMDFGSVAVAVNLGLN
jgi:hypothetical protein